MHLAAMAATQVFNHATKLYNALMQMEDFYNTTIGSDQMRCLDDQRGCFPQPFAMRDVPAAPPGYTIIVDASVTGVRAAQLIEQMMSGGFMDDGARRATMQVTSPEKLVRSLAGLQSLLKGKLLEGVLDCFLPIIVRCPRVWQGGAARHTKMNA